MRGNMTHPNRPTTPYRHDARSMPGRVPAPVAALCGVGMVAMVALAVMVVCGCDGGTDDSETVGSTGADDDSGGVMVQIEGAPRRLDANVPIPPPTHRQICGDYAETGNPGVWLDHGVEYQTPTVVADLCMSEIPNLSGCWVSDYEFDLGDLTYETDLVELRCAFDCGGASDVEIVTVAGFPGEGYAARLEIVTPCPVVMAP